MRTNKELDTVRRSQALASEAKDHYAGVDAHAPRKVTFGENVILMIKLFSVLGLLGAALWCIDLWMTAR